MDAVSKANVSLDRNGFMASLIRHLSGTLQDVIGLDDAEGFVSLAGQRIGADINRQYRNALSLRNLSRADVPASWSISSGVSAATSTSSRKPNKKSCCVIAVARSDRWSRGGLHSA